MEVLQVFGSHDQEIDSWFTNHEPLLSTKEYIEFLSKSKKTHFEAIFWTFWALPILWNYFQKLNFMTI